MKSLQAALAAAIAGEVRFDAGARAAYASDASNYRQVPIGVVLPRSAAPDTRVVADGFACREQIEGLGNRPTQHLAEVLAAGLR